MGSFNLKKVINILIGNGIVFTTFKVLFMVFIIIYKYQQ